MKVGDKLPLVTKGPIERLQLVKYAGASGDWNRIHFEEGFAVAAGYPSVFAHGMLSMAFLGEVVAKWVGPHRVRKIGCRFKAITWPGDVVTCHGEITALREENGLKLADVKLWAETQKGTVTVEGSATVSLP